MRINIDWQPAIGDPTISGWVTVFGYFATAVICCLASASAKKRRSHLPPGRAARFWLLVALLVTFLGFNKQLDLQSLFTQLGRHLAHLGGWYHQRQTVQSLFILCFTTGAIITATALLQTGHDVPAEVKLASVGLCILTLFFIIRAAEILHIDQLLGNNGLSLEWTAALELGSIAFVAIAGLWYWNNDPDDV